MKANIIIACALVAYSVNGLFGMKPQAQKDHTCYHNIKFDPDNHLVSKKVFEEFGIDGQRSSTVYNELGATFNELDITSIVQSVDKKWNIRELVKFFICIASKEICPCQIEDKRTLFRIVKLANVLKNNSVIRKCATPLIETLLGTNQYDYAPCETIKSTKRTAIPLPNNQKLSASPNTYAEIILTSKNKDNVEKHVKTFINNRGREYIDLVPEKLIPDQKHFISYKNDTLNFGKLWNFNNHEPSNDFGKHTVWLNTYEQTLTCYNRKSPELYHSSDRNPTRVFHGHTKQVIGITCLPGKKQFLSFSADGTIKFWILNSSEAIRTFSANKSPIIGLYLLPNENQFITYSLDNTFRKWNLYPLENITFKQIKFCYDTFTRKYHTILKSLPTSLQTAAAIVQLETIKTVGPEKEEEEEGENEQFLI